MGLRRTKYLLYFYLPLDKADSSLHNEFCGWIRKYFACSTATRNNSTFSPSNDNKHIQYSSRPPSSIPPYNNPQYSEFRIYCHNSYPHSINSDVVTLSDI